MKARTVALTSVGFLMCLTLASLAIAQEGHPMTGSWVGYWGATPGQQNRVVIVIEWTGTELSGTINPGPNAIPIRTATADPTDWSLHVEADATDAEGRPVTYVIDGTIDDLLSYNRTIAGTWKVGEAVSDFSITRQ